MLNLGRSLMAARLIMIKIQAFKFNPFQENTYVLYDATKEAVIIDPGCSEAHEEKALERFVTEQGLTVKRLLNTHCHIDHVLGNDFVSRLFNLKLEAHSLETQVLAMAPRASEMWGVPFKGSPKIEVFLAETDVIKFGNSELSIIHAPGHSPGSICFYSEKDAFLIGGDVLFYTSIGRTDLPGGNHEQLLQSIKTKLFKLPDNTEVYSGHGPKTSIGFEKLHNPFLT